MITLVIWVGGAVAFFLFGLLLLLFPRVTGSLTLVILMVCFHHSVMVWLGFRQPLDHSYGVMGFWIGWMILTILSFVVDINLAKRHNWDHPLDILFGS